MDDTVKEIKEKPNKPLNPGSMVHAFSFLDCWQNEVV